MWLTIGIFLCLSCIVKQAHAAKESVDGNWVHRDEFEARIAQLENRLAHMIDQQQQKMTLLKEEVNQLQSENRQFRSTLNRQRSIIQLLMSKTSRPYPPADKVGYSRDEVDRQPSFEQADGSSVKMRSTDKQLRQLAVIQQDRVAFTTNLVADLLQLRIRQIIKFDNTISNLGNGYDTRTGVFTTRVPGWYVISVTASFMHGEMELQIVKDGNVFAKCWSRESVGQVDSVSQTAVVHLEAGNEVWVQTHDIKELSRAVLGEEHTSFTGFLLYQD